MEFYLQILAAQFFAGDINCTCKGNGLYILEFEVLNVSVVWLFFDTRLFLFHTVDSIYYI